MRIINSILYDLKFQLRHGFYYAYLFVTVLYIFFLNFLPDTLSKPATILVIFTDPSVLGAFFIGAIFLLEKSQNTLEGLFVTPLRIEDYILSKIISLTVIAILSSLLIAFFSLNSSINLFILLIGVILTSFFYTCLGLIIALYSKNTNQYFLKSMITVIFILPIIEYLNISHFFLLKLLPGKGSLLLIDGSINGITSKDFIYAVLLLALWCLSAYYLSIKLFYKKVILKIGG